MSSAAKTNANFVFVLAVLILKDFTLINTT